MAVSDPDSPAVADSADPVVVEVVPEAGRAVAVDKDLRAEDPVELIDERF